MKIRDSVRIVFLGDGSTGKTSIISQFIEGYFFENYKPTIEDFHIHSVQLKGGYDHNVMIVDCSGSLQFPAMRELNIRTGRGFVIVFAVNSESSFNEAVELYKQIIKIRGTNNIPIVLVGNKSDLPRTIDKEEINKRKSTEMNDIPYIETSAKYDRNIKAVFQQLLILAVEQESQLEQNRKLQDKQQQSQMKKARNQQLLRRFSTFGSLPNINLIRRKSTNLTNNHSSNNSICSDSSSSSGAEDSCSPKHVVKNKSASLSQKPMFFSPLIKRRGFNEQLSLDETKIKHHLNQRLMHQKISNTKSFDTSSYSGSNSASSNNSTNGSIKGSKESLETTKCQVM